MECKVQGDPTQCHRIEQRRCVSEGYNTERYEQCMINLSNQVQTNGTEFCSNHYLNMTVWKDNYGPSKLGYWLRKHNCFEISGVPKGKRYCQDYKAVEDSWGTDNLFTCYLRNKVEFSQEYCDTKHSEDKYSLMQCYGTKGVKKGEEFCTSNFDAVAERD